MMATLALQKRIQDPVDHLTCRILQFAKFFISRGGSRTAALPKMETFVIIVNGFRPLTIMTKHSMLDVAADLNPPLISS